jgi:hypothetical protein
MIAEEGAADLSEGQLPPSQRASSARPTTTAECFGAHPRLHPLFLQCCLSERQLSPFREPILHGPQDQALEPILGWFHPLLLQCQRPLESLPRLEHIGCFSSHGEPRWAAARGRLLWH